MRRVDVGTLVAEVDKFDFILFKSAHRIDYDDHVGLKFAQSGKFVFGRIVAEEDRPRGEALFDKPPKSNGDAVVASKFVSDA
ncbi:hypothetical protein SDC9_209532 [bioreactor metagenome]|uniref:Uncharacterized protein n=1 Tax=bioreactor metagenome TaxID=1076179 RepID=A0A645JGI8_9ZZZZ